MWLARTEINRHNKIYKELIPKIAELRDWATQEYDFEKINKTAEEIIDIIRKTARQITDFDLKWLHYNERNAIVFSAINLISGLCLVASTAFHGIAKSVLPENLKISNILTIQENILDRISHLDRCTWGSMSWCSRFLINMRIIGILDWMTTILDSK